MIKKTTGWFLDKLITLLDRKTGEREIRSFIEKYYARFQEKKPLAPKIQGDLQDLERIMVKLGWLNQSISAAGLEMQPGEINRDWLVLFENHQVMSKLGLAPGTGKYLDRLDAHPPSKFRALISATLEELLRHVEVRREKSFGKFVPGLPDNQKMLEKHDLCILFSKAACRHHDLRFLNAAFKLNEWHMKRYRRLLPNECLARFLLALAEQELCAKELLI